MKQDQSSSQSVHILTTIVTLIVAVGMFHFWLPTHIQTKVDLVLKPALDQKQKVAQTPQEVPQSLLDYIEKVRADELAASESDSIEEEDLIEAFKKFEKEDYSDTAREILASRFKLPQTADNAMDGDAFLVPDDIKDRVDFWTHVFGLYTTNHVIFYNKENVGIVYSVLDFSQIGNLRGMGRGSFKAQMIREEKARIKAMIKKVARLIKEEKVKLSDLDAQEKRLAKLLLANNDHVDISEKGLLRNIGTRKGFAHRIRGAIAASGKYMEEMRRIFSERGLPPQLTMIPFIESAFNLKAYSHAGAAGIWQFIEATGKRYLRIDEFVDERYDPILGAYAAATHLANEFKFLKSWPMTVNAYNTGPGRMLQAKRQLGTTDISKIIKFFKGSGYGKDSKNYFPEFLAAVHIYENQEEFFGEIKKAGPEKFEFMALPGDMNIQELAREAGVSTKIITDMNLSLKPDVAAGLKNLPKGYLLKVPADMKDEILVAMKELYKETRYATHHIVRRGDSIKRIAKTYDISVDDLSHLNKLLPKQKLRTGDILQLPSREFEYSTLTESEELVVPDKVNNPIF